MNESRELRVGDLFADQDQARFGRQYRVIKIVAQPDYEVRKPTAICISRGKVTPVAVARLLHPSRFERVVEAAQ